MPLRVARGGTDRDRKAGRSPIRTAPLSRTAAEKERISATVDGSCAQAVPVTAGTFLIGDTPSIADVFLVPQMYNARRFGVSLDALPKLVEIDARCQALPRWNEAHPSAQPDAPKE